MDRISELKAEIQQIAWTQDPAEKDRLRGLKKELFHLCAGSESTWPAFRGVWESYTLPDSEDDLAFYHSIADALSVEDCFD